MVEKILFFIGMIVIGIVVLVVLVKFVIIPLFKFLFHFFKMGIKIVANINNNSNLCPGVIDEGVYLIVILFLALVDTIKLGGSAAITVTTSF